MVQLQTYTRAIPVIPSAFCTIPNPALLIMENTTTSGGGSFLYCLGADFINKGVKVGDIVYIYAESIGATIVNVIDEGTLELNTIGPSIAGIDFRIYAGTQNDASKSGCVIYSLDANELTDTITIAGDYVPTIICFPGQVVPIQVSLVSGSTNSIIALW